VTPLASGDPDDVLVLLFPGQGSQSPGMLLPWLDLPDARDRVASWSERTGLDLLRLGTTATAEEIRDTAVAQPLLTAAALLTADAVTGGAAPDAVCGHSVGELSALAVAGVITADEAVSLATLRGAAMASAAAVRPTGMSAVLGGDAEAVQAAVAAAGLSVATVNVAGQVVVGGSREALDAFAAAPPAGARVRPLDVAGAFHTAAMAPAAEALAAAVARLRAGTPTCTVVANADGAAVPDGEDLLQRLVGQLTGPVRFDRCLATLAELGADRVVEVAPGGTLAGLAKRALPGATVLALKGADDLATARALRSEVPA
jgi:[acyl-carrier-protein] S-malonyltransferase